MKVRKVIFPGDAEGSLRTYLEALEFCPYYAPAHYNLGIHYGNSQEVLDILMIEYHNKYRQ